MVQLSQYNTKELDAEITAVAEMTLAEHLGERIEVFRDKMKIPDKLKTKAEREQFKDQRLKSQVLVVTYKMKDETVRSEFFNLPKISGWNKSNLRLIQVKNTLPDDTEKWIGTTVKVTINQEGYPELAK